MIRILLVDDHAIVREGYQSLLSKQADLHVVAEASHGGEAYRLFTQHQPDLVITDLSLPGLSGMEVIAHIKQRYQAAKILVFSMHQNPIFATQAFRAGALGYVTKSSSAEVLLKAIHDVNNGLHFLSADIAQALAIEKLGGMASALESLTSREFEILRLLVEAKPVPEIARMLNISPKTVSNSHYLIKRKLAVSSDIELTRLAIKLKVIHLIT